MSSQEKEKSQQSAAHTEFPNIPAEKIKQSLLHLHSHNTPLEELIATAEAAFEFIHLLDTDAMDIRTKNAFYQLHRQFDLYKGLVEG